MIASAESRASTQAQDAIIRKFLKSACPVCLVPHDPEIHLATLRLRDPLPVRDIVPVNHGAALYRDKLDLHKLGTAEVICKKCGIAYPTMNVATSKRCHDCAAIAQAASTRRSSARNPNHSHRRPFETTVSQRIEFSRKFKESVKAGASTT